MSGTGKTEAAPARGPFGLAQHPLMPRLLGEIHARPFQLLAVPRTIIRLAFLLQDVFDTSRKRPY